MTCGDKFNKNCPTGGSKVDPTEVEGRRLCNHPGCGKPLLGSGECVDGHRQDAALAATPPSLPQVDPRAESLAQLHCTLPEVAGRATLDISSGSPPLDGLIIAGSSLGSMAPTELAALRGCGLPMIPSPPDRLITLHIRPADAPSLAARVQRVRAAQELTQRPSFRALAATNAQLYSTAAGDFFLRMARPDNQPAQCYYWDGQLWQPESGDIALADKAADAREHCPRCGKFISAGQPCAWCTLSGATLPPAVPLLELQTVLTRIARQAQVQEPLVVRGAHDDEPQDGAVTIEPLILERGFTTAQVDFLARLGLVTTTAQQAVVLSAEAAETLLEHLHRQEGTTTPPQTAAPTVHWHGQDLAVQWEIYQEGGRPAILLRDAEGAVYATATTNVPDVAVPEGHVLIKDYNENAGLLDALIAAGIVAPPEQGLRTGHVVIPLCRLLVTPPQTRAAPAPATPQAYPDTVCVCGHWWEEHAGACGAPGCPCQGFEFDPEGNSPEAIADRGGDAAAPPAAG